MDNENETTIEDTDELEELNLEEEVEETDTTDWKAEAEKARGIAKRLQTKLEKAKAPPKEEKKAEPVKQDAKTGALDENALDFLDLKGITDEDEIDIIEKVIEKTGQTVRQALKDDYVTDKLEKLREKKKLQDATPSGTKRGGGQVDTFETALAKYERTGELPTDFTLKSRIINTVVDKENTNKPSWH